MEYEFRWSPQTTPGSKLLPTGLIPTTSLGRRHLPPGINPSPLQLNLVVRSSVKEIFTPTDLHRWIEGFHCPDPPCKISSEFTGGIARITPEKPYGLGYVREVKDAISAVDYDQRLGLDPVVLATVIVKVIVKAVSADHPVDQFNHIKIHVISHSYLVISFADEEDSGDVEDRFFDALCEFEDDITSTINELCEREKGKRKKEKNLVLEAAERFSSDVAVGKSEDLVVSAREQKIGIDPDLQILGRDMYRGKFTKEEDLFGVKGPGDSAAPGKVEVILLIILYHHQSGIFEPICEGPFTIEQVYEGGAYLVIDANGVQPMPVINGANHVLHVYSSFMDPKIERKSESATDWEAWTCESRLSYTSRSLKKPKFRKDKKRLQKAFKADSASDSSKTEPEEETTNLYLMGGDHLEQSDYEEVCKPTYDQLFEIFRQASRSSLRATLDPRFREVEDQAAYRHYKECGITLSRTINPAHLSYPVMDLFAYTSLCFILTLADPFSSELLLEFYANLRINPIFTALTSYVNRCLVEITYKDCAKLLQLSTTGDKLHIIVSDPDFNWSTANHFLRQTNTPFHVGELFSQSTHLHPGDGEPQGAEEEEVPAPVPDPAPLHQHSQFDQLVERFDRWETRFDAYVVAQEQQYSEDMARYEQHRIKDLARFDSYITHQQQHDHDIARFNAQFTTLAGYFQQAPPPPRPSNDQDPSFF
ncbi:hypothetical protein KFK09_017606 [Dendrobium nobile]|uniref:Uncharacterized protein n=1 Tax=Dendrobium nobile TaxID=94219 RepID=A0A8T3B2T4_DENNO|nr:hypothetical protein KFK09_017606 [Dendrobium nobile]